LEAGLLGALEPWTRQEIAAKFIQRPFHLAATKPLFDGRAEAVFGPVKDFIGQYAPIGRPQEQLLPGSANMGVRRQLRGPIQQPMVEKGSATLDPR
jgi:hypothetical protein